MSKMDRLKASQKQSQAFSQAIRVDVKIHEAMLVLSSENIKTKNFFVEAKSECDSFCTSIEKGANPKWNFSHSINTLSGTIDFRIFEISGTFRYCIPWR